MCSLEKPEAFAAARALLLGIVGAGIAPQLGDVGQRAPFERGQRVIDQQRAGDFLAVRSGDCVKGFLQKQRARGDVVRIAGNEVDGSALNHCCAISCAAFPNLPPSDCAVICA